MTQTAALPPFLEPELSMVFNATVDPKAEKLFAKQVEEHKQNTVRVPVTRMADAFMDETGLVQGKYRFTASAFFAFTKCLSPTAGAFLCHVATGKTAGGGNSSTGTNCDRGLAVKVFNDLLRLRFTNVDRLHFLVDENRKVIEGTVGARYKLLFNADLFSMTAEFCLGNRPKCRFAEGILAGRKMILRFASRKNLFDIPIDRKTMEPFFSGFHFANSETGNSSVRAASILVRQICDNKAVAEFQSDARLRHIRGGRFERKLYDLLDVVQKSTLSATKLKRYTLEAIETRLGLGGSPSEHGDRVKLLESVLVREGISAGMARESVAHAMLCGSYGTGPGSMMIDSSGYKRRTVYDLFNAVTHVAKSYSLDWRERAERLAYRLLVGKIRI